MPFRTESSILCIQYSFAVYLMVALTTKFVPFAVSSTSGVNNQPVAYGDTDNVNNQPVTYSDTDGVNRIFVAF